MIKGSSIKKALVSRQPWQLLFLVFMIVFFLLPLADPVEAENGGNSEDFAWEEYEDGVKITDYLAPEEKDVVIPGEIDGKPVLKIGEEAFAENALTAVTIPESVQIIGESAFYENALTEVAIPDSVTKIKDRAFSYNDLTEVTFPDSLEKMGSSAFFKNALTEVVLPDGLKEIEHWAFRDNSLTKVTLPDGLKEIGASAFAENALTEITFPASVEVINYAAFVHNNFTSFAEDVNFEAPENIISLSGFGDYGEGFIEDKNFLKQFENLQEIGRRAFHGNAITEVVIPEGVTKIGRVAFSNNALSKVTFPDGLEIIEGAAFHVNALKTVTIPASVEVIGSGAFGDNEFSNFAEDIYFEAPENIISLAGFNGHGEGFIEEKDFLKQFKSLEVIGKSAFSDNALTAIIIPDSVEEIKSFAFSGSDINKVTIGENVSIEWIDRFTFSNPLGTYSEAFKESYEDEHDKRAGTYKYDQEKKEWFLQPGVQALYFHNCAEGKLKAWSMEGKNKVDSEIFYEGIENGFEVKEVVDATGNDNPDIYFYNRSAGKVELWLMDGLEKDEVIKITNPAPHRDTIDSAWEMMAVYDLDGSGEPDIIWQAKEGENEGDIAVWQMEGYQAYNTGRIHNEPGEHRVDPAWEIGSVFDLLKDGEPEIIWQAVGGAHEDQLAYWKLDMEEPFTRVDSARIFNHPGDPSLDAAWNLNASADLFKDGTDEFIYQHEDGKLAYWQIDVDDRENVMRKDSGRLNPDSMEAPGWLLVGAAKVDLLQD